MQWETEDQASRKKQGNEAYSYIGSIKNWFMINQIKKMRVFQGRISPDVNAGQT